MGWPKGRPRGPRKIQANHITGVDVPRPLPPSNSNRWGPLKVKANWEDMDKLSNSPDRFHIPKHVLDRVPGMSFQWVTNEVMGQVQHQHRSDFTKQGWTPAHQSDFNGLFDGMFMPKGAEGEINNGGQVLMYRPQEITDAANERDYQRAKEQIRIKEMALRGGELPGVGDSDHESALRFNKIQKHRERIEVAKDGGGQ